VHPELSVLINDDLGGTYNVMPRGGGGGESAYTLEYQTGRAPDPRARELRVEITEIRWERFDSVGGRPQPAETESGPWMFVVPL
jgi:hypothetical protein